VREVSHHAAEVWLPILNIGGQLLIGAGGNLIAGLLIMAIQAFPRRKTKIHVRWNVQLSDGSTRTFEVDGDGESAVEAARIFESSLDADR
jgi:hypothetical protein